MAKCKECGKRGLFLKLTPEGVCVDCLSSAYRSLKELCKPELLELADLSAERDRIIKEKDQIHSEYIELKRKMQNLSSQLISVEETIELESFSLYKPKYSFLNSDEYKKKLEEIRNAQKQMIKSGTAASCSTNWTVNGSKSEGRKMTKDTIKLILRSFNNECDISVSSVSFNNFDRCVLRIKKAFDTLNKLSESNHIRISNAYLSSKIDELHLAHEYQLKKQEEKEALQALRAQQREESKLAKEIEAARKEAEKEKKHYMQAVEKIKQQLESCSEAEKTDLIEKQNELLSHLDDIAAKLEDMDYRQANQKAGYVYIISNIGSFGEGIYKIGMTRRLDPMERIYELGDASVPFMFDVHAMIFSDDAPKLEAALHHAFSDKRINMVNNRREYFRVSLDEIKRVVRENHDKTVEFKEVADAQQYRESLLLRK